MCGRCWPAPASGMLANTMGRLYNSAFYALWDTRTPLKFAFVRVTLSFILGYLFAIPLPASDRHRISDGAWRASPRRPGLAAWVEFTLLRRSLNQRVGWTGLDRKFLAQLWGMAFLAGAIAFAIKFATPHAGPRIASADGDSGVRRNLSRPRLCAGSAGVSRIRRDRQAPFWGARICLMVPEVLLPASSGASATLPPYDSTNFWPSTICPR